MVFGNFVICDIENFDSQTQWDLFIDKLRGEAIYTSNLYALSILSCLALCSIIFIAFIKA